MDLLTDGRTDGQADGRTVGRANERTGERADGHMVRRADGRTVRRADGRKGIRADSWTGGRDSKRLRHGKGAHQERRICLLGIDFLGFHGKYNKIFENA